MDPVTIVFIGVVAFAAAPTVGSLAVYGGVKLAKKISSSIKKRKAYKMRHDKNYQEKLKKTRALADAIEKKRSVAFKNTKTGAIKNVNVNEIGTFDFEKDIILKGTVYTANPNGGEPAKDTIYLYQPRVYGVNGVSIGPKVDKNGHLYDNNSYLLRMPGDPDIYSGYVPKREVLSGRRFDYVNESVNAVKDPMSPYINIVLDKDEKGNFIPLDKNNAEEMKAFNQYVQKRKEQKVDQHEYLDNLLARADSAKAKYDEANKPRYAKPTQQNTQKVKKSRASKAKTNAQNDYYNRIINMNMMDSMRRQYGIGPGGGMPPGGPMGGPAGMPPGGPMGGGPGGGMPQNSPSGGRRR